MRAVTTKSIIAIDGPAGAGKSTVARKVARKLGYVYVDSGAMYRALTLAVLRAGVSPDETEAVTKLLATTDVTLYPGPEGNKVCLNGEDVTDAIRDAKTTAAVSYVAAIPQVRSYMTALQQKLANKGGVVMDGRDIGTVVLPQADVKVFLTASVEERARRRFEQLCAQDRAISLEEIRANIEQRDAIDASRQVAPLRKAVDAVEIDTTNKTITEVVDAILDLVKAKEERCCTK